MATPPPIRRSSGVVAPADWLTAVVDPSERLAVRTRLSVVPSLVGVTLDALGGRDFGVAPTLRHAIRTRLRGADLSALSPMVRPSTVVLPASLVDLRTGAGEPSEALAAMRDLPSDFLEQDLAREPPEVVRHWVVPLRDAAAWRDAVVGLLERVWFEVYAYSWRSAAPALSREIDIVARAATSSTTDLLLDRRHADLSAVDGVIRVRPRPGTPGGNFDRRGRPLVILPLAIGPDNLLRNFVDDQETLIGYTPSGVQHLLAGRRDPAAPLADEALDHLLGPMRAQLLRALRRPENAGALAARLGCSPNVLSYHLGKLEDAGLVTRRRTGQHVRVNRSERGEALLDLYS